MPDMVNHASSSPSKPAESSRVRRERDEENAAALETPSKKSRHAGKDSIPEAPPDVAGPIAQGNGEDGNNADQKELQESVGIVNDENAQASVDPSPAPAGTPEPRPEPPAREVYRIPSYAGVCKTHKNFIPCCCIEHFHTFYSIACSMHFMSLV